MEELIVDFDFGF